MGAILCEHCTAACCRYVAVPLDPPRSARDYDDIRWYVMHEGLLVYLEEGDWYIQFSTRCRNLGADNRCTVYATRPDICRDYEPGSCDYVGGMYGYEAVFTHPRQVEEYYEKRTGKKLRPLRDVKNPSRASPRRASPRRANSQTAKPRADQRVATGGLVTLRT